MSRFLRWVEAEKVNSEVRNEKWRRLLLCDMCVAFDVSTDGQNGTKRATRSNTALETTNTTSVANSQLQAMIDQGVTVALAARDTDRNTNGDDSHNSGMCVRRT
ncbi:hypothetical protein Tco_1413432 [Tanacetum coccineum]